MMPSIKASFITEEIERDFPNADEFRADCEVCGAQMSSDCQAAAEDWASEHPHTPAVVAVYGDVLVEVA